MTNEFARLKREVVRALVLWALVLLVINWLSFRISYHTHPSWHYFKLNSVPMRTDNAGSVQVLNLKDGEWVSFEEAQRMLEKMK